MLLMRTISSISLRGGSMINLKYRDVTADWLVEELYRVKRRMRYLKPPKQGNWFETRIYQPRRNNYERVYIRETKKEYTKRVKSLDTYMEYMECKHYIQRLMHKLHKVRFGPGTGRN